MNRIDLLLFLHFIVLFCLLSCKGAKKAKRIKHHISSRAIEVNLNPNHLISEDQDSVVVHYNGCSNLLIQSEDQAILFDPYFSNSGPLISLPFQKIKQDTLTISRFFTSIFPNGYDEKGIIKILGITHGHHDHLGDANRVHQYHLNQDTAIAFGNKGVKTILQIPVREGITIQDKNIISLDGNSDPDVVFPL